MKRPLCDPFSAFCRSGTLWLHPRDALCVWRARSSFRESGYGDRRKESTCAQSVQINGENFGSPGLSPIYSRLASFGTLYADRVSLSSGRFRWVSLRACCVVCLPCSSGALCSWVGPCSPGSGPVDSRLPLW